MSVSHKDALVVLGLLAIGSGATPAHAQEQQPAPPGRYIDGVIGNVAGRIILYSELAGRLEQARQSGEKVTDS